MTEPRDTRADVGDGDRARKRALATASTTESGRATPSAAAWVRVGATPDGPLDGPAERAVDG
ncbi:hypothetical protein DQW50_08810 [Halorubrum sp. 48-1-W]|uniref:hypothetical protein n=1 Tax=Halorubrum sp. 48-1-W TaxID=2249761 RepID=UPI000DCB65F4|nr:hypothetical protein [Halorubrum sp. 48-1-W]RAW45438.1 hypothetical protein DQW50_08810 [Halorubrum sp. 48-1-W]